MSGMIQQGPKLAAYLMWGNVRLRLANSGQPSWLRYQWFRVAIWKYLVNNSEVDL